jgi:hypothetical protein
MQTRKVKAKAKEKEKAKLEYWNIKNTWKTGGWQ